VAVIEGMVDGVVWLPTNSEGVSVRSGLGSEAGHRVAVTAATNPADLTKGGVG
jgi:NADH-quinone oxidoreductase subunit G